MDFKGVTVRVCFGLIALATFATTTAFAKTLHCKFKNGASLIVEDLKTKRPLNSPGFKPRRLTYTYKNKKSVIEDLITEQFTKCPNDSKIIGFLSYHGVMFINQQGNLLEVDFPLKPFDSGTFNAEEGGYAITAFHSEDNTYVFYTILPSKDPINANLDHIFWTQNGLSHQSFSKFAGELVSTLSNPNTEKLKDVLTVLKTSIEQPNSIHWFSNTSNQFKYWDPVSPKARADENYLPVYNSEFNEWVQRITSTFKKRVKNNESKVKAVYVHLLDPNQWDEMFSTEDSLDGAQVRIGLGQKVSGTTPDRLVIAFRLNYEPNTDLAAPGSIQPVVARSTLEFVDRTLRVIKPNIEDLLEMKQTNPTKAEVLVQEKNFCHRMLEQAPSEYIKKRKLLEPVLQYIRLMLDPPTGQQSDSA